MQTDFQKSWYEKGCVIQFVCVQESRWAQELFSFCRYFHPRLVWLICSVTDDNQVKKIEAVKDQVCLETFLKELNLISLWTCRWCFVTQRRALVKKIKFEKHYTYYIYIRECMRHSIYFDHNILHYLYISFITFIYNLRRSSCLTFQ